MTQTPAFQFEASHYNPSYAIKVDPRPYIFRDDSGSLESNYLPWAGAVVETDVTFSVDQVLTAE